MSEPAGIHIFSLAEARKTLPLIRPIVEDLTDCHKQLREQLEHVKNRASKERDLSLKSAPDPPSTSINNYRDTLSEYVHEIYDLGAEIHDFQRGRIDFPARRGHRIIYLCWDMNDEDIGYWHDTYSACHQRQSIDDEEFE